MLSAMSALLASHLLRPLPRPAMDWGIVCLLCLCAAFPARGDESLADGAAAALRQAQDEPSSAAFTQDTATYPDLNGSDLPRAAFGNSVQYTDITRWLTPLQASRLGLTLGVVVPSDGAARAGSVSPAYPPGTPLAYDLGLRWRSQLQPRVRLDLQAWARTHPHTGLHDAMGMIWGRDQGSNFGTRLEVQWSASRTRGLVPELGAIGVQLQGDARLVLRARRGGPMVYYRAKF